MIWDGWVVILGCWGKKKNIRCGEDISIYYVGDWCLRVVSVVENWGWGFRKVSFLEWMGCIDYNLFLRFYYLFKSLCGGVYVVIVWFGKCISVVFYIL